MPSRSSSFAVRAETFGFDSARPWAESTLRLLFNVPRLYEPLVEGWESHFPHTRKSLDRLVDSTFVHYQPPVVVDTRTGEIVSSPGRPVTRYKLTAKGCRLTSAAREDLRVLERAFSSAAPTSMLGVLSLLEAFDVGEVNGKFGLSMGHGCSRSSLPSRTARWWVRKLTDEGYLRTLPEKMADVRVVVPGHWRPRRVLVNQLRDVLDHFRPGDTSLHVEWRLNRTRYLDDIDPSRVSLTGATDFDHDIFAQTVLRSLLLSPRCVADARLSVEPLYRLALNRSRRPWRFEPSPSGDVLPYQPDAELRERHDGRLWRSVVEYERYQTRRDGWDHIERFLGWCSQTALPFEPVVLRFVVDGAARRRAYIQLIEAFADYSLDHPDRMCRNQVVLAVASQEDLLAAPDPLDWSAWTHINLTRSDTGVPAASPRTTHPYDSYFGRG